MNNFIVNQSFPISLMKCLPLSFTQLSQLQPSKVDEIQLTVWEP